MHTQIIPAHPDGIMQAAQWLMQGKLVAIPTETVYGLAADARQGAAVARIFTAKNRPHFNPLIVHLADLAQVERYAILPPLAGRLARAFWPGPLTMVLPLRSDSDLSPLITAGLDTVAIRIPAHPVAQALLRAFDGPLAAPSANPSGRISPTRCDHVIDGLNGQIDAVLDGGPCRVGVESTIIGLLPHPVMLRPGGIAVEAIETCLGHPLPRHTAGPTVQAPGQLASHYAPDALLRLNVERPEENDIFIGFGALDGDVNLSPAGDLIEAAANLFHMLRKADQLAKPHKRICCAPIPHMGLGLAINDRLTRAAAPRP